MWDRQRRQRRRLWRQTANDVDVGNEDGDGTETAAAAADAAFLLRLLHKTT